MGAKTGTKSSMKLGVVKKAATAKSPKPSKTAKFAHTGLDSALVAKAVDALLNYHEKKTEGSSGKLSLLGNDRPVQVQLTLLRAPGQSQPKPAQLVIPHPFYKLGDNSDNDDSDDLQEPEICLIVKDESKPWCLEMIEKFPDQMSCVKKVLTLDSLRKKHQSHEQKRQLLAKYNMFMADNRILPMMSKALGKPFIKAKKLPVPVDVRRQTAVPFAIQKALRSTYMTVNTGTCISIRAGHTGMEAEKLAANIIAIAKSAPEKIPRSWANIQMICIKTADSVSLPIYNKTPEALREIAKMAGIKADDDVSADNKKAEEKENNGKSNNEKKKKDLKSPLLQALKKQKKAEAEKESSKKLKKQKKAKEEKEISKKTKKEEKVDENQTPEKKAKRSQSPQPTSSTKKKQKTEEKKEKPVDEKEKKDFIAAKKFKGAKKGYCFKMGQKGLGYYVDRIPVVDKMVIDAIRRMGGGRGSSQKKRKKGGRRR